ncbi:PREDICTED: probable asparagine--tRNA ligase, mitochondrial [Amphimedon queenslandica]|uniref:asparagine--tRNA ligase n=1 Tax=Amphimedon queenslandica TaxID=400682 RepID=A0A1X7VMP2_AMPQE|nr:PREDICTED: probable asparagine--tRNA ligase, mitochondrial [Amphimedon queenslandica]|eukprot:XP_019863373.1 PREDICTED: probable asparagine--tRNA ligase, mitochondrial [Amphimedon queenslandica]
MVKIAFGLIFGRFFSSFSSPKWLSVSEALTSSEAINKNIKVQGWLQSARIQKSLLFLDVNDGSSLKSLQAVMPIESESPEVSLGASVQLEGLLVTSSHPKQPVELAVSSINVLGSCDNLLYPFKARINHPADYIRQFPHLRARTKKFSSVLRIRNAASIAVHEYFQRKNFLQVHTPLLSSSDCEGAGDLFIVKPEGTKDASDFFGVPVYLTVSGQLHAETLACGLSNVYTFGPTFRAEKSHTSRHLSEFYMIEAELVTGTHSPGESLDIIMQCSEDLCKSIIEKVLTEKEEDLSFLHSSNKQTDLKEQLENMIKKEFKRLTYKEAVELLDSAKENFSFRPKFGENLGTEHEKYIVQEFGNTPVFITEFPASIKPFYTRNDTDTNTAYAMDLLMPNIGEVVGGSVREERFDILENTLKNLGMDEKYQWYLDLRRFGTVPHGGFGLGFERLLQVIVGAEHIRDVIPYPRFVGYCPM